MKKVMLPEETEDRMDLSVIDRAPHDHMLFAQANNSNDIIGFFMYDSNSSDWAFYQGCDVSDAMDCNESLYDLVRSVVKNNKCTLYGV